MIRSDDEPCSSCGGSKPCRCPASTAARWSPPTPAELLERAFEMVARLESRNADRVKVNAVNEQFADDERAKAKKAEARAERCRLALLAAQAFLETDGQEGAWLRTIETVRDALKEPIE